MQIILTGQTRSDAKRKYTVFVSDCDHQMLTKHNWQGMKDGNVYTRINGKITLIHRMIMNAPKNLEVDHIDGNRLNNQRENLRLCNSSQNKCNRGARKDNKSGFKGVSWHSQRNKWTARIKTPYGKYISLGLYDDKIDAAKAYNQAAREHHGVFAFINQV